METSKYKDYMKVEIPSTTDSFEWVLTAISSFLQQTRLTAMEDCDIKTALSEAIHNSIMHAYNDNKGIITIMVGVVNDNTIEIVVKDKGIGIADVKEAMKPLYTTAEEKGCIGIGFTVMESFMTSVKVRSTPGKGTTVRMRRKVNQ